MPLNLNKVHNYEKIPGKHQVSLREVTPYVRFVHEDDTPIIVQKGAFYSDGGQRIKKTDIPPWFWEQAKLINKEKRERIGLMLPGETKKEVKKTPEKEASELVDEILGEVDDLAESTR